MNADTAKTESNTANQPAQSAPKPTNPAAVRKAIALGKDMRK